MSIAGACLVGACPFIGKTSWRGDRQAAPPHLAESGIGSWRNHAHAHWADGVVRLTLSEQQGDQIEQRAVVMMTLGQVKALWGLMDQAAEALAPQAAGSSA